MVVRGLRSSEHNPGQILRAGGKVYMMGGWFPQEDAGR